MDKIFKKKYSTFKVNVLPVSTNKGMFFYPFENVLYIKSDNQYTNIFLCAKTKDMKVKVFDKVFTSKSLKYYENLAINHTFIRVDRSHCVNINYIRTLHHSGVSGHVVLADGTTVRVSKDRKADLIKILTGQ
jgi:two-component system LytT family response regulator